jgi:hypothetical protein
MIAYPPYCHPEGSEGSPEFFNTLLNSYLLWEEAFNSILSPRY